MNGKTYFMRTAQTALVAMGVAIASGAVLAQEVTSAVVVEAKHSRQVGRTNNGAPIEEFTLSRHISYADLDLVTSAGTTELDKRLNDAAKEMCNELFTLPPVVAGNKAAEIQACVRDATKDASAHAHAAVVAAEQRKGKKPG